MPYALRLLPLLLLVTVLSCIQKTEKKTTDKQVLTSIEKLTQAIKSEPENPDLYNKRAIAYLEKKETDNALSDINKAITLNSKNAAFYCTLSDIYFSMGKVGNCNNTLEKALTIDPKNTEALLKLAELNFFFKRYEKTFEYIKKTLDIERINPQAYFMRAMAFKEHGDTAKAVADFQSVTEQDPKHYDAWIQLGLLFSIKNDGKAIDYFNNALNIKPNSIEALYAKAMFLQENGDFNNAIAAYTTITQIDPNYKYAFYNLGYIHLVYLKVYKAAIDYFTKAIACDPAYYEAFYNRGYCYELRGDIMNAANDYKKALELKTNYQKAIDGLNRIRN